MIPQKIAQNEAYHILNKGIEKKLVFEDKKDLDRFVATLDYYRFKNPGVRFSFRKRPSHAKNNGRGKPLVEILSFCLMPNHFHFLIKERQKKGVSDFLSKVTNSYTKYFNNKYKRVGPLFQGTFKSAKIENKDELLQVSRHIHLNPIIDYVVSDLKKFPFSSYLEYLGLTEGFCKKDYILSLFSTPSHYEKFVLDKKGYRKSLELLGKLTLE